MPSSRSIALPSPSSVPGSAGSPTKCNVTKCATSTSFALFPFGRYCSLSHEVCLAVDHQVEVVEGGRRHSSLLEKESLAGEGHPGATLGVIWRLSCGSPGVQRFWIKLDSRYAASYQIADEALRRMDSIYVLRAIPWPQWLASHRGNRVRAVDMALMLGCLSKMRLTASDSAGFPPARATMYAHLMSSS